jgi:hypothetical protein
MNEETCLLTQVEFTKSDLEKAEEIAKALGYKQTAYTSTSALWGLFCLPENPRAPLYSLAAPTNGGCIIKTRELGFLFVQDGEDRGLGFNWSEARSEDPPAGRRA